MISEDKISFDPFSIGSKIAELMTLYYGEDYILQKPICINLSQKDSLINTPIIIIAKRFSKENYTSVELENLKKDKRCLVLTKTLIDELDGITLFKKDRFNEWQIAISLSDFPELTDFFFALLDWTLVGCVTEDNLNILIRDFLKYRLNCIKENYVKTDREQDKALKEYRLKRDKSLNNRIKD